MTRAIDIGLSEYMKSVNDMLRTNNGVTYSEIAKDVHGDYSAIRVAYETSIPFASFASRIATDNGFRKVADDGPAARETNLRLVALALFAKGAANWVPARGAGALRVDDGGDAFMVTPGKLDNDEWGFKAWKVVPEDLSYDGAFATMSDRSEYVLVGGGLDIEDAVNALDNTLQASPSL